jgi:hypothetical protein
MTTPTTIATLATLISLTVPQRKILARALVFWAMNELNAATSQGFRAQILDLADRVRGVNTVNDQPVHTDPLTDTDLAVVLAFAPIALDLDMGARDEGTLRRAYAALGVTSGAGASIGFQTLAAKKIRAIMNPPAPEPVDPNLDRLLVQCGASPADDRDLGQIVKEEKAASDAAREAFYAAQPHPLNAPIHPDVTKAAEAQLVKVRRSWGIRNGTARTGSRFSRSRPPNLIRTWQQSRCFPRFPVSG